MIIRANERLLLAGKTGSGKTYFARRLLAGLPRLVVIDPKASLKEWGLLAPTGWRWRSFLKDGAPGRFRILPPIEDDLRGWYETLFQDLYNAGNVTVYIDEAYAVAPPGSQPGKWLTALYTRGRERGIGVWAATQRPTWIPLFLISEADWIVTFRLNLTADRKRIADIAGDPLLARIPDTHGFWLYNVENDDPHYYSTAVLKPVSAV